MYALKTKLGIGATGHPLIRFMYLDLQTTIGSGTRILPINSKEGKFFSTLPLETVLEIKNNYTRFKRHIKYL